MRHRFPLRRTLPVALLWLLVGTLPALAQPTVVSRNPVRNDISANIYADVVLTFSQPMGAGTADKVRIFNSLTRGQRPGFYSVDGAAIRFLPNIASEPGEVVSVSVPATVLSNGGIGASKHVYQFTVEARGGSGVYTNAPSITTSGHPSCVATGDIDNDFDTDILSADLTTSIVTIARNDGDGNFTTSTVAGLVSSAQDIKLADVDADGDLDLLSTDVVNNRVLVRLNNGAGVFSGGGHVAVGGYPNALVTADVDADGDLDVLTANFSAASASIRLNNGHGVFSGVGSVSVGTNPNTIVAGDIDSDGDLDLITTSSSLNTASVRRNNGNGVFSGVTSLATGASPHAATLADIDGDHDLDFLTANQNGGNVSVFRNAGAGTFAAAFGVSSSGDPVDLATADVDGDGDLDLLTVNGGSNNGTVVYNNGAGVFSGARTLTTGNNPEALLVADLDGDLDLDAAFANFGDNAVAVRLNEREFGAFGPTPERNEIAAPLIGALNIPFSADVKASTAGRVRVFGSQAGGRRFGVTSTNGNEINFTHALGYKAGEVVNVSAPATIQSVGGQSLRPFVFQFTAKAPGGTGVFLTAPSVAVGDHPTAVATGDVDGDGDLDLLVANSADDEVSIRLNDGAAAFSSGGVVAVGDNPRALTLADVDGDGDLDLLTANTSANTVSVRFNAAGVFSGATSVSVGTSPRALAVADVDGDGDLDLLTANYISNTVSVRLNNGTGTFSGVASVAVGGGPASVVAADVDIDGDLDLLTANSISGNVSVRINDGTGTFGGGSTVSAGAGAQQVLAVNLDDDYDVDLLILNATAQTISVRFGDTHGVFTGATELAVGVTPTAATASDLDGDTDMDLLVTSSAGNSVLEWYNNDGIGGLTPTAPVAVGSAPTGLTTADLDNDGDLDLLTANDASDNVTVRLNDNAFTVTGLSPALHAVAVPRATDLTITLSEAVNPLTAAQLRMYGSQGEGRKTGVAAGIGNVVTYDPLHDLQAGEQVSVTVRPTMKSADGQNLHSYVYQFTAAATGGTGAYTAAPDVAVGATPGDLVAGDINADGFMDLLTVNEADDNVSIRLGDGLGTFSPGTTLTVGDKPAALQLADINADGDLDLLVINTLDESVSIFANDGSGGFGSATTLLVNDFLQAMVTGDIDGDGDLDLLVGSSTGKITTCANDGAGHFTLLPDPFFVGGFLRTLQLADVDNDGDLDLLIGRGTLSGAVVTYFNHGHGITLDADGLGVEEGFASMALGDLNSDGRLDLVLTDPISNHIALYTGLGDGFYLAPEFLNVVGEPYDVSLADVDGDGDLDILTSNNAAGSVSVRLNNGNATFTVAPDVAVGAAPQTLFVTDVDNDGDLDFLTANYDAGMVSVRLNDVTVTPPPTLASFTPEHGATGTVVTITGTNFTDATQVTFDGVDAPGFTVNPAGTEITVASPPATFNGPIAVTTPGGTVSTTSDFGMDLVITGAETVPAGDFHHITVTATGAATLGGAVSTTAPVVVQPGGALVTGGHVLSGAGAFTLEADATLRVGHPQGLSVVGATGAVQLTGGRTYDLGANYAYDGAVAQVTGPGLPGEVRTLTIDNPMGVSLTQATSVRQVLTVAGAGDFTLGGQPLTLLSDATGTALLVNAGAGKLIGEATAQCWLNPAPNAGLGYRHLASPAKTSTFSDLACPGFAPKVNGAYNALPTPGLAANQMPTVFGFDETRAPASPDFALGYYSPLSLNDPMGVAQGYSVYLKGGLTPDFTGELSQGDVTRANLTKTGSFNANTQKSGWHLIGNPYPSPIDWDLVTVPAGLNPSISVFRSTAPNSGVYLTRANGLGNLPNGIVPLGQAFFARVDLAPVDLTFTNACRVTTYGTPAHYRPVADPRPAVSLTLRGAGAPASETDGTTVYFQAGATAGVDREFDGERPAHNVGLPTLVSLTTTGAELAVNGLPEAALTQPTTVELLLDLPTAGTFELALSQLANLAGADAMLLDRQTGTRYALVSQPAVTFAITQAGELRGRFALVFNAAGTVTGTSLPTAGSALLTLYPNPARGTVQVGLPAGVTRVELLDATGRVMRAFPLMVAAENAAARVAQLELTGVPAGVYMVKAGAATQRLVIE